MGREVEVIAMRQNLLTKRAQWQSDPEEGTSYIRVTARGLPPLVTAYCNTAVPLSIPRLQLPGILSQAKLNFGLIGVPMTAPSPPRSPHRPNTVSFTRWLAPLLSGSGSSLSHLGAPPP